MSTLQNDLVWIEDVVAAAIALHEHKTHVGLTCDAHDGVYIHFYDVSRCEVVYNYGDEPEGAAHVAAEVFELVRLIPEIKKSVPHTSLEAQGGLRAVLDAFRLRRLVMDYITKTRNALL